MKIRYITIFIGNQLFVVHDGCRHMKDERHTLRFVREALDLTLTEMAAFIGAAEPTIRAIEGRRLRLSQRLAGRLAELTGLDAEWLMRGEIGSKSPSEEEIRMHFNETRRRELTPSAQTHVIRSMVLPILVAGELGYEAAHHTGFFDVLQKRNAQLLWKIPNSRTRQRIFQQARDILQGDDKAVSEFLAERLLEMEGDDE